MYLDHPPTAVLEPEAPVLRNRGPVRRWRISDAAAAITGLVALSFGVVMALPRNSGIGTRGFTAEHVLLLGMVDSGQQRLAHRVSLVALAVLCLLGAVAITRPAAHSGDATRLLRTVGKFFSKWSGLLLVASVAIVFLSGQSGRLFFPPIAPQSYLGILGLSVCVMVAVLMWMQRQAWRPASWLIWGFVVGYVLFLCVPGLIRTPVATEPGLSWYEWHYSTTLAQADRLAAGLHLGSQVNLNYGLVHTVAIAAIERAWGLLDFGAHIRLVQASQIFFLAVAILAFYLCRPNNPVFVLFATFLVGPWVSTSHVSVFYPNQSGWRSFGLAAGVAILMTCRQSVRRAAWTLGATACVLVLYNPETGVCLTLGFALFLLSRQKNLSLSHLTGLSMRAAGGAAAVGMAVLLFFRAGLGVWPHFDASTLLGLIGKFGQGYGGLSLYFDPLAIVIFLHSTWIVGSTVLKWRTRNLEFEESAKLAVAATILGWFAYFVNRPHAWNLWTFQFLYVFLLADLVSSSVLRRLSRHRIVGAAFDVRIATLTFLVLPTALYLNHAILFATVSPEKPANVKTAMVSGILMPSDSAAVIQEQAGFLVRQEKDTLFFSCHSYTLSLLTKRFNPLFGQDIFAETATNADFERLVSEINRMSPHAILFDAPSCQPESADNSFLYFFHSRFFERLQRRIAGRYEEGSVASGWQVWRLRIPENNSGIPHEHVDPLG